MLAVDFADALGTLDPNDLDAMDTVVYGLRPDFTMGFRNAAWSRYAAANGAPELGDWADDRNILDVVVEPMRSFYEQLYRRVQASGRPEDHEYDFHTPDLFRRFRMRVVPLRDRSLLVLHHLAEEHPHDVPPSGLPLSRYVGDGGIVVQCAQCRRTRRAEAPATWDWVPGLLQRDLVRVSHGLCPVCLARLLEEGERRRAAS